MPDNPIVWIVAILAAAAVVLFALWKGEVVEVGVKPLRLHFKRGREGGGGDISIGEGMVIKGSKTGDIAGVKGASAAVSAGNVAVGKGAGITDSTTGDIVGVKETGTTGTGETKP